MNRSGGMHFGSRFLAAVLVGVLLVPAVPAGALHRVDEHAPLVPPIPWRGNGWVKATLEVDDEEADWVIEFRGAARDTRLYSFGWWVRPRGVSEWTWTVLTGTGSRGQDSKEVYGTERVSRA